MKKRLDNLEKKAMNLTQHRYNIINRGRVNRKIDKKGKKEKKCRLYLEYSAN